MFILSRRKRYVLGLKFHYYAGKHTLNTFELLDILILLFKVDL